MSSTTLLGALPFIALLWSKIPFHHELSITVDMHMPGNVIPLPPNEDIPAAAEFTH